MQKGLFQIIACVVLFIGASLPALSQVTLPALVRDSMVLQRDTKLKLWGWAKPGETIRIQFMGNNLKTKTGKDGKWWVTIPPISAGGPFSMQINGSNQISLQNILVGDVWLCAGQSNMAHQMELHGERYADEIARAHFPMIRHFFIPTTTSLSDPLENLPAGSWKSANPKDVLRFSAVAYFFAKSIYEKYRVPIGLINASVGGTPIQAWISEEGLKDFPSVTEEINKNKDSSYVNGILRTMAKIQTSRPVPQDKGLLEIKPWYDTSYIPKGWRNIMVPGYWEDQGIRHLDGIVWYRKEIQIADSLGAKEGKISLGRIVDANDVYLNGKLVGSTGYQYPQRRYTIPAGLLKRGKNILVIRLQNYSGKGGFVPDKPYFLIAGGDTIPLTGEYQYKVGSVFLPEKNNIKTISLQNSPTALYNGMIAPIAAYNIKGILWYQGESNWDNPSIYAQLMKSIITDWRTKWRAPDLPFLFVQLPNYDDVQYLPSESPWAELREAQRKTLAIPNTGMAITIDLGEWNDIHPDRKKEVGERLALIAMNTAYGDKKIVSSGPLFKSQQIRDNTIVLHFTEAGSGLTSKDANELSGFSIAGKDKNFVWAKARIEGDSIIVWNENISQPLYVRYAWADNPADASLYNKEGLPASPFKTDN